MRINHDRRLPAAKSTTTIMTKSKKISKQLSMVTKMHKTLASLTKKSDPITKKPNAVGMVRKN